MVLPVFPLQEKDIPESVGLGPDSHGPLSGMKPRAAPGPVYLSGEVGESSKRN